MTEMTSVYQTYKFYQTGTKFYQTFKQESMLMFLKLKKLKRREQFQSHFIRPDLPDTKGKDNTRTEMYYITNILGWCNVIMVLDCEF